MAIEKQETHRPGALKQTNKAHKHGRHRSKGSISIATKGKVSVKTISKKQKAELNKQQRRNQSVQIRQNKRDELLAKKRSIGGLDSAPFLIGVIPLNKNLEPTTAISILKQCDPEAIVNTSSSGVIHISIPRFKQRFSLVIPTLDNELAILDTLKVCDTVIFLFSAITTDEFCTEAIDEWGNKILLTAFAQGLPTPVIAVTDLESVAPKKRNERKQQIQKLISKWLPDEKVIPLDKNSDGINIIRKIGSQKRKNVIYRDRRPYMYGEHIEYVADEEGALGTLKVTGYLRGKCLSVNGLVHLPGLGDFQMSQIDAPNDPFSTDKKKVSNKSEMDCSESINMIRVIEKCDPSKQETLDSENIPDPMDAEQTWPTNEELQMAEEQQKVKKIKKVPKGWSDYQAAWIPDDDAESISSYSTENELNDEYMDAASEGHSENSDAEEEFDTITESEVAVNDQQYDQEINEDMEKNDLEKLKAAKTDLMFPDEVDTPQDTPARIRFQKYRGLESFRTSPWDTNENLPSDYARIFQFENFDRTKKRVLKEEGSEGALPGWYITVHIKNVSQLLWKTFEETKAPVVIIGLFHHEHKMTVVNTVLKRTLNYNEPIKSKERLIFQCGYRRFIVNPIFSQHTNGQKHKFERFFQPESTAVATFYAPIQFPPAPVICYKEINNKLILVATGNLLSCNPDRIVTKRIVLSGHLLKVHKRSAVVRFMFFNREDIIYFKPCKLRTKYGRIGHIKEPLGTHGHMKCVFDGQLKSQDTVLLNLYKRIFPKWTYEECIVSCINNDNMDM